MMVAAHPEDLRAAATCGLRTAFVSRPLEFGPGHARSTNAIDNFDIVAGDFHDLADQLGCPKL